MTEQTLTEYTPTELHTAEDKAKWEKKFKNFILKGCKDTMFNKPIYSRLKLMFEHIAHYDKHGFYAEWFSTPARRLAWLKHIAESPTYGNPNRTWSDVEQSIKRWVVVKREQIINAMTGMTDQERAQQARDRRYIATGGVRCLACDSTGIEGYEVTIDSGGASQKITCTACGATWEDVYTLTSIENFEKGDEQP